MAVLLAATPACKKRVAPAQGPVSHGFDSAQNRVVDVPVNDAEREKLRRAREGAPHFTGRPAPADHGLDVYVDEVKTHSFTQADIGEGRTVATLVPTGKVRVVLAHGESELWIPGRQLGEYNVRVNQRGQLKLEWRGAPEGGGGGGSGRGERGGENRREHEVRDLQWLEVRTADHSRLADEPAAN